VREGCIKEREKWGREREKICNKEREKGLLKGE
jgi:hypothetical protein